MKFFCDQCNAQYMIADEKVGPRGVKVKCKKCSHVIVVKPASSGDATTVDMSGAHSGGVSTTDETTIAPAPKKSESEISGAFDSLFGGAGGGQQNDSAFSNNQTVVSKSPLSAAASEKEWYVAIGDAQVGPIDIAEVTQRWDNHEVSEDSLAWKSGMPDWIPIGEIPQLSFLVSERPHKKSGGAAAGGGASASSGGAGGSGAVAKAAAPVEWKPSAASALSSLVQEEIASAATPKDAGAKPPEGVPDLGLPGVGTSDLFGGKVGGETAPADSGFGGGAAWSVPSKRPSGGGNTGIYVMMGGIAAVVLVIAGGMFYMLAKNEQKQPVVINQQAPAPAAAPAAPAAPAAAPAAPAAGTPAAGTPAATAASEEDEDEKKHPGKHKAKHRDAHAGAAATGGGAPAVAEAPAAPAAPPKAALSKDDIWNVVRANAARAAPCLKTARGRNEIPPNKYTFTLNWTIRPNGSVANPQVIGPPEVLHTSLPSCFATIMGQWQFPASASGAPIANFPFGPINVP